MSFVPTPAPPLRRQQAEALAAIETAWSAGSLATWVVLPPGGGKTRVGLEALALSQNPAVVLCPNTAVQSQWIAQALAAGLSASAGKDLSERVSVLTYQSVALFAGEEDTDPATHMERLHPNAALLIERLADLGPLTLILDECHHLLEVWGELLVEVLEKLPKARILALTATPPASLSEVEAQLVSRLFGKVAYSASIPGFVRDGHLAPFREMVAFTEPTASEAAYLKETSVRFAQIRSDLMTPDITSIGFLEWLDSRFVSRALEGREFSSSRSVSWGYLAKSAPDLADAVLRACHAELLALPPGARLREKHRSPLTGDDWALLLDDFIKGVLLTSSDPRDESILAAIRAAAPGVGLRLTKKGLARTTSPVDRVIARSASKSLAAVGIADVEWAARGDSLRMLVLCDYERASAQVASGLLGVIEPEEGSARAVLRRLAADPLTAALNPVMVTGKTVSCAPNTAHELLAWLTGEAPNLELRLSGDMEIATVTGNWSSKDWVPLLTKWFEQGQGRILVGTRALLGEGWDARRINVLIDLTTATTPMAVTQTRGRALRTDPLDPEKVAHTWTVVCVSDDHTLGGRDYQRFVRKHTGFLCVTEDGLITDGVAHVSPDLTPFAPPDKSARKALTRIMFSSAASREQTRLLWRVGEPYADSLMADIRIRAPRSLGLDIAAVRPGSSAIRVLRPKGGARARLRPGFLRSFSGVFSGKLGASIDAQAATLSAFSAAVADALLATGKSPVGSDQVRVVPLSNGGYRIWLEGASQEASQMFADSLDEALSPLASPRYLVPRYSVAAPLSPSSGRMLALRSLFGLSVPAVVVWHMVPTIFAARRKDADVFTVAWNHWVSPGASIFSGSPEAVGALASQRGDDPWSFETGMRLEWK